MLVGRVAKIIAKHTEFTRLLRKCYPNNMKNTKSMNARLARGENHCQTQGIHMLTKKMLAKPYENHRTTNKYVNDSGTQRENHCL